MEHEVRLKTFEEMAVPFVAPEVPRRQKLVIDMDISQLTVDHALRAIGGLEPGHSAYLVCSEDCRDVATKIGAYFKLPVVLLPPEILHSPYVWAVIGHKGTIFSNPPT